MKLSEISSETLNLLKNRYFDRIVEKHEGSWTYEHWLEDNDFFEVNGHFVLLPLPPENLPNITFLRVIESRDGKTLTLFLKDTTFIENSEHEFFDAGFMAVCEKFEGEDFYTTIVYHEWFILDLIEERLRKRKENQQ